MTEKRREPVGGRGAVEDRVRRDRGLELPGAIFRYDAFLASLGPSEARALDDLGLRPFGVMDLFGDPAARPPGGIDVRVHGRHYRDPPEFMTFMHGGSDGLRFGLWFDDGRTCSKVASYHANDGGTLDVSASTPRRRCVPASNSPGTTSTATIPTTRTCPGGRPGWPCCATRSPRSRQRTAQRSASTTPPGTPSPRGRPPVTGSPPSTAAARR
jgi:hypothetical protein